MRIPALLWLFAGGEVGSAPTDPSPIYGGEPTGEGEYPTVVAFQVGSTFCSGTVVAPRLVLTAAHCVAGLSDGAPDIPVYFGSEAFLASMSTRAVAWGAHPDFCAKCRVDIHDLGYLVLEADFLAPSYPDVITSQAEWDELMQPGTDLTIVGFGEADNSNGAPMNGLGTKRKVGVGMGHLTPLGLEFFAGGGGKDSCVGDSGGPAFIEREDGTLVLAGVLSRGSDPCGEGGFYGAPYAGLCFVLEETGVDLLPDGCADCACLDTAPPEKGCGCTHQATVPGWFFLLLLPLWTRSRRSRAPTTSGAVSSASSSAAPAPPRPRPRLRPRPPRP